MVDRFGDYPDVVAYLLEIGLLKSYLDQVFCHSVLRKKQQITISFEPMAGQIFLTQDYFQALSVTNLKVQIAENRGRLEVIFTLQKQKDYEILEELIQFAEKLAQIKLSKG